MPQRAASRCTRCPRLATKHGRCDEHQRQAWENPSANTRTLSGGDRNRFHDEVMSRADGHCAWCGRPAKIADHIIEIADGGDPFDPENGQALCSECDEKKTKAAARMRAKRRAAQRRS